MENNKRKTKPDWNKLTAEDLQKLEDVYKRQSWYQRNCCYIAYHESW